MTVQLQLGIEGSSLDRREIDDMANIGKAFGMVSSMAQSKGKHTEATAWDR